MKERTLSPYSNLPPIRDSYSYQSVQRQRQLTLGDLLLENRIVFLQGEIYTGNANEVVMKLLYLQSENRRKDIHFYINSPGGDVIATLAIYDTMQMISCPVATYCVGQAARYKRDVPRNRAPGPGNRRRMVCKRRVTSRRFV